MPSKSEVFTDATSEAKQQVASGLYVGAQRMVSEINSRAEPFTARSWK